MIMHMHINTLFVTYLRHFYSKIPKAFGRENVTMESQGDHRGSWKVRY